MARYEYQLGVPVDGRWRELLDSDAEVYGGGNLGNGGLVSAIDQPWAHRPHSLRLLLPPLGTLFLKPA